MTRTEHFSLNDELDRIEERLDEIREEDNNLRERFGRQKDGESADAADGPDGDSDAADAAGAGGGDADGPESVEETDEWQELDAEYRSLQVEKSAIEDALRDWGGGGFELKALDFGEVMRAKDETQARSYEVDTRTGDIDGVPRDGYYKQEVLALGVVEAPAGAPDDPRRYSFRVGNMLYEEVDRLTTGNGMDLENLSLSEESR